MIRIISQNNSVYYFSYLFPQNIPQNPQNLPFCGNLFFLWNFVEFCKYLFCGKSFVESFVKLRFCKFFCGFSYGLHKNISRHFHRGIFFL